MGKKKKLLRFADTKVFSNVTEPPMEEFFDREKGIPFKHTVAGNWRSEVFKNDNPIVLELGCGKGEYSVGMGRAFPEKNFIGVDIKGNRIWYGAKQALDEELNNVHFLRTRIDFITAFFQEEEIDEIWITFPDPQEKENRARKRLTGTMFIDRYKKILKPNGVIHLKTDSAFLYEFTQNEIDEHGYKRLLSTPDLYEDNFERFAELNNTTNPHQPTQEILKIKTYYEELFTARGHVITYTQFIP